MSINTSVESEIKQIELNECACCHVQYEIYDYNFHNLCDNCFNQFDNQKMRGRFGSVNLSWGGGHLGQFANEKQSEPEFYTESSKEFIKSGRCTHSDTTNKMQNVIDFIRSQVTINNMTKGFFTNSLTESDPEVDVAIESELSRQQNQVELIASENIVSKAVLEAQGSILTNKYAEGYCGKRYYGGCNYIDMVEKLAIDRVKKLFNCSYANVQPHSGSQANQGVMMALVQPGDTILGMSLAHMGHLTHGAAPNQSGKWFKAVQYGVRKDDGLIDFDEVSRLALEHKPKLIIAGASAYPRIIDWKKFREIADQVGAYLLVDMAHYAGLVAGGVYPSPLSHAHVVTATTHKTLRGPRGGIILSNDEELGKRLNSAIFPGIQGGPLCHIIAAKAVCFKEALDPSFKIYAQTVIDNAKVLADELIKGGLDIVSGGTDSHIVLVDLRRKGLTGNVVEKSLERAGMTCNKNAIPFDPEKPVVTSGIRLGTPASTTRGFGVTEFKAIGQMIVETLDGLVKNGPTGNESVEKEVRGRIEDMCKAFPIY